MCAILLGGCGGGLDTADDAGGADAATDEVTPAGVPDAPIDQLAPACRGPGRYEAGKEGSYQPCCSGLREVFYLGSAYTEDSKRICVSLPLRIYACVAGRCGDGVCEAGEADACGCVADCPSALWGDVPTGELGDSTGVDAGTTPG